MINTLQLIIKGRVQGVCFRASTQKQASKLQLDGWVKNRPDGDVEILVRGEAAVLDEFIAWCHKGPVFARVDQVIRTDSPEAHVPTGFTITD